MVQVSRTTPATRVYEPITTVEDLREHLQWALSVELSTVPPYLCALYSIRDQTAPAARLIRDVVIEEMLHMALVSNLMNGIGGKPSLADKWVPKYPGYMPHHAAGGPYIQLQPLSADVARVVFMAIEQPELDPSAPAEGDEFATIGQFYKAIEEGFENCFDADRTIFHDDTGFQRADTYVGGGGGELVLVHDLDSAKRALVEITEQGEGAPMIRPPYPGDEQYGSYDNYGTRTDGTYGPIIATPWEMSHYGKFKQLAIGEVEIPPTHPMRVNPSAEGLSDAVQRFAHVFDACYTTVLQSLELAFTTDQTDTAFFREAFPMMQFALPRLATVLMRTPEHDPGPDPEIGPNAGPSFLYRAETEAEIVAGARSLRGQAPDFGHEHAVAWNDALDAVIEALSTGAPARRLSPAAGKRQP